MRFGEEEQFAETRAESTAEREVTGRLAEMRTGRGTAGLARGETEEKTRPGKAKERVTEERESTEAKVEDLAAKEHSWSRTW